MSVGDTSTAADYANVDKINEQYIIILKNFLQTFGETLDQCPL